MGLDAGFAACQAGEGFMRSRRAGGGGDRLLVGFPGENAKFCTVELPPCSR
jgi:hypothetical protein